MSSLFEKLYAEVYEPKLMPQDLLNNLELENYHTVNFKQDNNFLLAITTCDMPNGELGEFEYYFRDDKLQMLIQIQANGKETTLYDRNDEILKLRNKIKENKEMELEKISITYSA